MQYKNDSSCAGGVASENANANSHADDYLKIIAKIERLRDRPHRQDSLQQVSEALEALRIDLPAGGPRVVLVAGTNGKGTVAKTLECLLQVETEAVGLFTSPHLIKTTERVRSFGRDLTEGEFVAAYQTIAPVVERFNLSHFQILNLMMAEVFFSGRVRPKVDWAVIEVGVGGRLDPTRLIPHSTTVITSIGMDHVELLGGSLASIAREKFGAIDRENLVVHAPWPGDDGANPWQDTRAIQNVREIFQREFAEPLKLKVFRREQVRHFVSVGEDPVWQMATRWGEARLKLKGLRAVENTALALTVFDRLGFSVRREHLLALQDVHWPGRMEKIHHLGRAIYLSGDHNPDGVRSLAEILSHFSYRRLLLIVGIAEGKDAAAMLNLYLKIPRVEIILTSTPLRPRNTTGLAKLAKDFSGMTIIGNPLHALQQVCERSEAGDLIVVTGSLYLVGQVRAYLQAFAH